MVTVFLGLSLAAWADVPAGDPVADAVAVDITPEGFDALAGLLPALLPPEMLFDDVYQGDTCLYVEVFDLALGVEISDAVFTPQTDRIDVWLDVIVSANGASSPFELVSSNPAFICIPDWCQGYIEPFHVGVTTSMALEVVPGPTGPVFDVEMTPLVLDNGLESHHIEFMTSWNYPCATGGLVPIILPLLDGILGDALAGTEDDLELTIEDALAGLVIDLPLELGESVVNVSLVPSDFQSSPEGARLVLGGQIDAGEPAACMAPWDTDTVLAIDGPLPGIAEFPPGIDPSTHVGLSISDEIIDQTLHAVWRSGLLCQRLEGELTEGLEITTGLLGALFGPTWDELFPETQPVLLTTTPRAAPMVSPGPHDIDAVVPAFGLGVYAELEHRMARIVEVELDIEAGIDLPFDGVTGMAALALDLPTEGISVSVPFNEILTEQSDALASRVELNLGPLLAVGLSVLGDSSLKLPSMFEQGLTSLVFADAGPREDWLGAYVNLGPVPYDDSVGCEGGCGDGCGGTGCEGTGCEGTGCEGGGCDPAAGCDAAGCSGGTQGCDAPGGPGGCDGSGQTGGGCRVNSKGAGQIGLWAIFLGLIASRRRTHGRSINT